MSDSPHKSTADEKRCAKCEIPHTMAAEIKSQLEQHELRLEQIERREVDRRKLFERVARFVAGLLGWQIVEKN